MTCRRAIVRSSIAGAPSRRPPASPPLRARRAVVALLGLLLGLAVVGARADEPRPGDPVGLIHAAVAESRTSFTGDLPRAEAASRLRALLDRYADLPRIARGVLGRHWTAASEPQRERFVAVFESFLVETFAEAAGSLGRSEFGAPVLVESGDAVSVVRIDLRNPGTPPRPVLIGVGRDATGELRIVDVVTEAISLIRTFNADFGAYVRMNGGRLDDLIAALQQKTAGNQSAAAR